VFESFGVVLLASAVVWWFSEKLEDAAHVIGYRLDLPESVKGAVFYAVPSSFPELSTAVIAVLVLETPVFSVGLGTIAGSAVFNTLIIPALSVMAASMAFRRQGKPMKGIKVSGHVFVRDGLFYLAVVLILISVAIWHNMTKLVAAGFLVVYGLYVGVLYLDTRRHQRGRAGQASPDETPEMGMGAAVTWMAVCVSAIGFACYFLVEHTILLAGAIGVNAYVVAVVVTAAATSVPDTFISVAKARKSGEEAEASIVNALSSNIFDILVCLGVPVLLYDGVIEFNVAESIVSLSLLAVTTFIALVAIKVGGRMTRAKGGLFLVLYVAFVASAFFNDTILSWFGVSC
jgi:cation:H+ antiporter